MGRQARMILAAGAAMLLLAVVGGRQMSSAKPSLEQGSVTYEGAYVPLGSDAEWVPEGPLDPPDEDEERRIIEEYAKRDITYVVDSSELGEDQPSR